MTLNITSVSKMLRVITGGRGVHVAVLRPAQHVLHADDINMAKKARNRPIKVKIKAQDRTLGS